MLEQTAASPLAARVQLTHSSVQLAQFGGPVRIETSFGVGFGISLGISFGIAFGAMRGGMGSSAAGAT